MKLMWNNIVIIGVFCLCLLIFNFIFNKVVKKSNSLNLKFFKSFIEVVFIIIFIYSYLSRFELTKDISKTIMQSGTLLIAIATFAAQRVLSNVISGIAISASKPFNIGDKVKVVSIGGSIISEGIVCDINLRHTIIRKYDGQCDIVPNNVMGESIISNTNLIDNVGNFIELEISYDSDINKAQEILRGIISGHELTLNCEDNTVVSVKDFSSNGIVLRVLVISQTLDDSFKACSEIRKSILKEFKASNINIPYQTVTVLKE